VNTSPADQGYDTQESKDCHGSNDEGDDEKEDEVDDEADEEWLQSMGVGVAEIKKLNSAQSKVSVCTVLLPRITIVYCEYIFRKAAKATKIDQKPSSTVLVDSDEHVMALFNFLLNCRSISTTIGHLAGVPPTLLSPVAFHGATLKSLNVIIICLRISSIHAL
jgi:protein downstream neighbor of Son